MSHPRRSRALVGPALCLLLLSVACDLGDPVGPGARGGEPAPTIGNLRFTIRHVVFDPQSGTSALRTDGTQYRTAFGNTYEVDRLRYYVSEFGVQYESQRYVSAEPHLVDTDDPSTLQFYVDDVPADHYHDVVLTIGLAADENADGALPGAENDDMAWPAALGGGYYYMKVEGEVQDGGGTMQPFLTGTGRIDTGAGPSEHFVNISLTSHFNVIPGRVVDVELIMDVNRWYGGPNVIDLESVAGGVESDESVQTDMARNGAYSFTLGKITTL